MKSWQKQLQTKTINQFRSHLNVTPKSLAASTPDLSKLKATSGDMTPPSTSPVARQEELRRAGTLGDVSSSSWLKSQSMLDVASLGSTNSARDFGLDLKLYPAPENGSSAKSRSPSPRSREERFTEMSHGTVHFAAAFSAGK